MSELVNNKTIYIMFVNEVLTLAYWDKEEAYQGAREYLDAANVRIKSVRLKGNFVDK